MNRDQKSEYKIVFEKLAEAEATEQLGVLVEELRRQTREVAELMELLASDTEDMGRLYTST